jgi:hypothetical protein
MDRAGVAGTRRERAGAGLVILTRQGRPPYTLEFQRLTHGPVAQLGARMNGIHEVTGSIPVRSTNLSALRSSATVARDRQNDLANVIAPLEHPVRVGGAFQRKRPVNHRADRAVGEQRPHARLERTRDGALGRN